MAETDVRQLGPKRRRVLLAALLAALPAAVTSLVGGGEGLPVIELIWIVTAGLLLGRHPRAALRLMWWGALALSLICLMMIPMCGGPCEAEAVARAASRCDAVGATSCSWEVRIAYPFLLATLVVWLGATIVWIATKATRAPRPGSVPTARIAG